MGWWWPFRKSSNGADREPDQNPSLDKDLKQYYDDVVAAGQQKKVLETERVAAQIASNDTRVRATTDTVNNQKSLKQIAMDNCVEYEKAYSTCILQGTYFQRLGGCPTQLTMYEQCQTMQQEALALLGFARSQSDAQKAAIKAQADDLMIKIAPSLTISDAQIDEFKKALHDLATN